MNVSLFLISDLFTQYGLHSDTVRREAATITAVFPSPNDVMSILVQVHSDKCSFVRIALNISSFLMIVSIFFQGTKFHKKRNNLLSSKLFMYIHKYMHAYIHAHAHAHTYIYMHTIFWNALFITKRLNLVLLWVHIIMGMNSVMDFYMQRVLEDRVPNLLEKLLMKPSLVNPPSTEEGGLVLVIDLFYFKSYIYSLHFKSVFTDQVMGSLVDLTVLINLSVSHIIGCGIWEDTGAC